MEENMNFELFLQTLPYMAKGMCGIFVVTGILILSVVILNRATSRKKKHETPEN